jgi:putative DNA methylase
MDGQQPRGGQTSGPLVTTKTDKRAACRHEDRMRLMRAKEIITRRCLPHWYVPGAAHFVTYRIAGTIPVQVIQGLRARRTAALDRPVPEGRRLTEHRERASKLFFVGYDEYLDNDRTIDWLARPQVAAMIRANLYHHNGRKYHLLAYCVMPNHVHVLLQPIPETDRGGGAGSEGRSRRQDATNSDPVGADGVHDETPDARSPLADIMHSLKSYTAHQANALLGRCGQFWQHESYDHWVRDEEELGRIVDYICANPVKAKLADEPQEWFFCSAHDRFLQDGSACGLLWYVG